MNQFIPDKKNARQLRDQVDERFRASRALHELGFYNDAVSRLYYALFSAISLVFYLQGKSFSTHKSLISSFHKEFIHSGMFGKGMGKTLSEVFKLRHQCDYEASFRIPKEKSDRLMEESKGFIDSLFEYMYDCYSDYLL